MQGIFKPNFPNDLIIGIKDLQDSLLDSTTPTTIFELLEDSTLKDKDENLHHRLKRNMLNGPLYLLNYAQNS